LRVKKNGTPINIAPSNGDGRTIYWKLLYIALTFALLITS